MKKFEYCSWYNCTPGTLKILGEQRWDLVTVLLIGQDKEYFFKREINPFV